jgi:hypothetical protein
MAQLLKIRGALPDLATEQRGWYSLCGDGDAPPLSHTESMLCPLLTGALSACKERQLG